MHKRTLVKPLVAVAIGVAVSGAVQAQQWKPSRPINLIVPWAAGGSTDQVTRIAASEMEKVLGQTIVIVNQPGASGSIGTKSALDAPRDGYTWTAGAAQAGELGPEDVASLQDGCLWANGFMEAVADFADDWPDPEAEDDSLDAEGYRAVAGLLVKYADNPMDFADACLVWLANQLGTVDVLTVDERDFSRYRNARGRPFRMLPA